MADIKKGTVAGFKSVSPAKLRRISHRGNAIGGTAALRGSPFSEAEVAGRFLRDIGVEPTSGLGFSSIA